MNHIRRYERNGGSGSNGGSQYIYKHFCSVTLERRIRFQIIEKIRTDDLPAPEPKAITRRRTDRELYWISKLRKAYSLGLNDIIAGYGIRGKAKDAAFGNYNHLRIVNLCEPRNCRHRKNRHRKKACKQNPNLFDPFLQELNNTLQEYPNELEALIASKPRKFLSCFLTSPIAFRLSTKLRYLLEALVNYFRKVKPVKKDVAMVDWTIKYSHKIFDEINVNSLLKDSSITSQIPILLRKFFKVRKVFVLAARF